MELVLIEVSWVEYRGQLIDVEVGWVEHECDCCESVVVVVNSGPICVNTGADL